jgi:hypothetical protein
MLFICKCSNFKGVYFPLAYLIKKMSTDNANVKHRVCDFLYKTEYDW